MADQKRGEGQPLPRLLPHPDKAQALVHVDRAQWDQAIECLANALNHDFLDEECLMMLGACLMKKGKNGVSAALARQAIEIRRRKGQHFPEAMGNLAYALRAEMKYEAAEEVWRMALEVETDALSVAQILHNLGACALARGQPKEAIALYDRAITKRPDLIVAQFNRSFPNLLLGNWKQGWEDYDCGFPAGVRTKREYNGIPPWDGAPGKTVIVWGEQGIGDEIMFASCIPDLLKDASKVILDCHPRLVDLFKRSFPEVEIHGTRKQLSELRWLDDVKAHGSICLSQLATRYRSVDADFPGKPFLKAAPIKRSDALRIGIAWQGGTQETRVDLRTIPLPLWKDVLGAVDAEFYSLQYTPTAAAEVCALEEETGIRVRHYPGMVQANNYDVTASFVASLDLVITVPTAAWHLAGALGTPTWLLVPSVAPWVCGHGAGLWYGKTQTTFRQKRHEPWAEVMANVGAQLADFGRVSRAKQAAA